MTQNCSACRNVLGSGVSFVSGSGRSTIICIKETIVNNITGKLAAKDSRLTTAGAIIEAIRAKVVTPLTPTLRPIVGKSSPENRYSAGIEP